MTETNELINRLGQLGLSRKINLGVRSTPETAGSRGAIEALLSMLALLAALDESSRLIYLRS
jgi:hypothetical protein